MALFFPPCPYRALASRTMEEAGREWREVFTSMSVAAVRVALQSGLGVSVLPAGAITKGLRVLGEHEGFPDLPPTELALYTRGAQLSRTVKTLHDYVAEHVGDAILNNGVSAAVEAGHRA